MKEHGRCRLLSRPLVGLLTVLILISVWCIDSIVLQRIREGEPPLLRALKARVAAVRPQTTEGDINRMVSLHHCKNVLAFNKAQQYAVVSLLTMGLTHYVQSAVKLAKSLRFWKIKADLIMLVIEMPSANYRKDLEDTGWNICHVPVIEGNTTVSSVFLQTKMYSKLNAWALIEYDAILYVDSDTLVIRDPSPLFHTHLPAMEKAGLTLGAAWDRPQPAKNFNAGVLLLIPSISTFRQLQSSILTVPHNPYMAEQALLNAIFFRNDSRHLSFYVLPFIYNANIASIIKEREFWAHHLDSISILHYTVSKGWQNFRHFRIQDPADSMHCWLNGAAELCELWERL